VTRFGSIAKELRDLGVQLYGVSQDSPFSHALFAEQTGIDYPLLSDWGGRAARAFGLYHGRGEEVTPLLRGFDPMNTRGAFLVDRDGVVRHAWSVADPTQGLPPEQELLAAARALAGP
jgi:peroxiredoxin